MTKCVYVYILYVLHPRNLSNYMGFDKFNNLKNKILFLFSSLNSSKIKYYVHFILLKCNFVRRKKCSRLFGLLQKRILSQKKFGKLCSKLYIKKDSIYY